MDTRPRPDRSRDASRTDAHELPAPSGPLARSAGERRDTVTDDESAFPSPHTTCRSAQAEEDRLHVGHVVYVYAAQAAAPRARSPARSPQPDRSMAALAQ